MADMDPMDDILNDAEANAIPVQDNFQTIEAYINGPDLIRADGTKVMAADLDMDGNKVVNVTDPSAAQDAATKAYVDASTPPGVIAMFGGAAAPSGWLLCDGSTKVRATYPGLFSAIGVAFNIGGEAGTDFRLPNFKDKYPIGDSGTLTLGATVGSNDSIAVSHTHTGPSHTHTGPSHTHSGPSHSHSFSATTSTDGQHNHYSGSGYNAGSQSPLGAGQSWMFVGGATVPLTSSDGNHSHTVSGTTGGASTGDTGSAGTGNTGAGGTGNTGSAGSSGTDANRPSSVVVNYIIKT